MRGFIFVVSFLDKFFGELGIVVDKLEVHGHNTKGGSNGHFNHADPTKVSASSLL